MTSAPRTARFPLWARSSLIVALLATAAAATPDGCASNESGNVAAKGSGELQHLLQERTTPGAHDATCGAGVLTDAGIANVRRRPYLQRVTSTTAAVVWTTPASAVAEPTVVVRGADGAQVASARATVDASATLPGGGRQLVATIEGLPPGAELCYEVRAHDGQLLVGPARLRTAPSADDPRPIRFIAFGDSGAGGSDQIAALSQIGTVPFDFMIHTGDVAYDHGTLDDFETKFFGVYEPYLRGAPVFPASGNHDYHTDDARPFREVFVLPENGGAKGRERWYSFDWGRIHFVALDTERVGDEQKAWLEADLAANRLPWTIVYAHRPPHSSGSRGGDLRTAQAFSPLFERHRISLVLTGHDHHYERFQPIRGVTYVVTGGGGRGTRPVHTGPLTAYAEAVIHFVQVTVEGETLTLHAIDGTGREFDSVAIPRPGGAQSASDSIPVPGG